MKIKNLLNKAINTNGLQAENLQDYKIIVKANDKVLSGWGNSGKKGHCQLVLCKDYETAKTIMDGMRKDKTLNYINYFYINDFKMISGKTYTLNIAENCTLWNNKLKGLRLTFKYSME